MSLQGEVWALMMSDVSSASVDMLVSKAGLWVRNTLIHGLAPFFLFHVAFHYPWSRPYLWIGLALYIALQVVQLWSPGPFGWILMDSIFDLVLAGVSVAFAWTLAMRGEPR
ncbi:hypothetical protein [Ponticoccus sp. (in: a-proteobacteria)]|uniref:hypothetical protein n=1 Tax=Ponticoccus sp. (in: a-proteobacteria) TaxID=1925025 RepID=UPI003AB6A4F0